MTTSTNLNTFKIAKGTKAQILEAYNNGTITSTDFAIATDENYVTTSDLATVATSGSYNDLSNKPTIPTVNNATLTIQKNGTTVNTFTANASSDVTANITVPTQASDIGAQATLVSGTNIKTVGGTTLLGSGNIAFPTVDQTYSAVSTNAQSGVAVKSAIDAAVSSVYKPGGSVAFASLPTPGSTNEGYVYNVTDAFTTTSSFVEGAGVDYPAGTNVVIVDTGSSTYKFDTLTGAFQPLLVSGTNIKTINNTSILGSGNIDIQGGSTYTAGTGIDITNDVISVDGETTSEIALATVATSGSYNDLSNKPTIPTVNDATITITQGGVSKGSFTLNQASGGTIVLDAGGSSYTAGTAIDITSDVISVKYDNSTITVNASGQLQAAMEAYTANEVETLWNSL